MGRKTLLWCGLTAFLCDEKFHLVALKFPALAAGFGLFDHNVFIHKNISCFIHRGEELF